MKNPLGDSPHQLVDLNFQGCQGVIGCFLFDEGEDIGLIETGPSTTLPALLEALGESGLARLRTVIVTHVHLDHAGAVGTLLRRARQAKVYVHEIGAPHLIDPSRLLRSASRIYGNQMDLLWGEVIGVEESRVVAVRDGDEVDVGGVRLRVIHTPGHASHHIALLDPSASAIYTGDVAGVRLQDSGYVRPPTPPPDIDLDRWQRSIERILELEVERLYLTHFGTVEHGRLGEHLSQLRKRLLAWTELVRLAREQGQSPATTVDSLRREADAEATGLGVTPEMLQAYELATPYGMTVDGLLRYLRNEEPQPAVHS